MNNETIRIENIIFRTQQNGWKCECSVVIKQEKNLKKHIETKSHKTNLINKFYFAPPKQSLLRPDAKRQSQIKK